MTDTASPRPPIQVAIIPVTPFQQNCSLIWDTATGKAVFVDPGGETDKLLNVLKENGLTLEQVWLTHGHTDHAGAAQELKERLGVPVYGPHKDDQFLLDDLEDSAAKYGLPPCRNCQPDRYFEDGDELALGDLRFKVVHTPGHTPGHVVIYHDGVRLAFVGDVLFQGSIGRTDFPRGNFEHLIASITEKLWPLGDDMQFVPGHGPTSTFGRERQTNPFVSDTALGRA